MPVNVVVGDDVSIPVTLTKDDSTFTIDECAVVKAAIVSLDRTSVLAGPVTLDHSHAGSEWAQSKVMANIESAYTSLITTTGAAYLEIQVNDGGKLTWFTPINVVNGLIP
jgi:hypothetical protein